MVMMKIISTVPSIVTLVYQGHSSKIGILMVYWFSARSSSEGPQKNEEVDVSPEEPQRCTAALVIGALRFAGCVF